jgi:hypothetical protein
MTVKVREWTKGKRMGFEVDIRFTYPDGAPYRQRIKAPVESKSAAKRWGEARGARAPDAAFARPPGAAGGETKGGSDTTRVWPQVH